jgi:4-aminobutyrate aminotransferase/(S)-3-amino-2-methylpropionate transaminase
MSPTAAIVVEPMQGVGGIVIPPTGFLKGLREICDRHGILLVLDEIFCGFGRTGTWFGFQHEDVVPDLVVISKGLTGGLPMSAVVGRDEILAGLPAGIQSTTFEGNPVIAAAAIASMTFLLSIDAPACARRIGGLVERWASGLSFQEIGEVRGKGALWGLEIVKAGTSEPAAGTAKAIQQEAMRNGLLLYVGGAHGNVVGMIPPLVITDAELESGLTKLSSVLEAVLRPAEMLVPNA